MESLLEKLSSHPDFISAYIGPGTSRFAGTELCLQLTE